MKINKNYIINCIKNIKPYEREAYCEECHKHIPGEELTESRPNWFYPRHKRCFIKMLIKLMYN